MSAYPAFTKRQLGHGYAVRQEVLALSPTVKGDVSEVIHVDVLHLLTMRMIVSDNLPHHLAYQQHRVVVRSYVVVHLWREKNSFMMVSACYNGCVGFYQLMT